MGEQERDTRSADVVVIGSGAAGLSAALAAAQAGAEVVVLEKSRSLGGTTAVSGGVSWVPNNHHARAAGLDDSRAEALRYILRCGLGREEAPLVERYLDTAPAVFEGLEAALGSPFALLLDYPDYQPELPGGKTGGRALDNALFDSHELGEWASHLRTNPLNGRMPITITEAMGWQVFSNPAGLPYREVRARSKAGFVHGGAALIGRLLKACLAAGVTVEPEAAALRLQSDADGAITGVEAERVGLIQARGGVVLASGGFEWNPELTRRFLKAIPTHPGSPPTMTGDALVMAMAAGAELGMMTCAWWCPTVAVPGETYEGAPLYRPEFSVRCLPHSMIVNRRGRRFTSSATNYNDAAKPLMDHDVRSHSPRNLPAWLVVDGQFLRKYMFVTAVPGRDLPEYVVRGDSVAALAGKLDIPAAELEQTVASFNAAALSGHDADFGRGESAFDRYYGDPNHGPNPCLGTLQEAPFCAIPLHLGTIGTNGGPRVDEDGRVRHAAGGVIDGLYAAGNAMGGISGEGYPGPGITIGVAITFGHLAGKHAASRSAS